MREIEHDGFITREEDLKGSKDCKSCEYRGEGLCGEHCLNCYARDQYKPKAKPVRSMVLIKDLKMPEGCADCRLKDNHYKECNVTHKRVHTWFDSINQKPAWCPLTEVVPYGPEGTLYKEK